MSYAERFALYYAARWSLDPALALHAAYKGLRGALRKYDPARGRFVAFARKRMRRELACLAARMERRAA